MERGGADVLAVGAPGEYGGGVFLDLNTPAAAKPLLPPPQFAVDEGLIDGQTCGQAGNEGRQGLSVGFTGGKVAQHKSNRETIDCIRCGAAARKRRVYLKKTACPAGKVPGRRFAKGTAIRSPN